MRQPVNISWFAMFNFVVSSPPPVVSVALCVLGNWPEGLWSLVSSSKNRDEWCLRHLIRAPYLRMSILKFPLSFKHQLLLYWLGKGAVYADLAYVLPESNGGVITVQKQNKICKYVLKSSRAGPESRPLFFFPKFLLCAILTKCWFNFWLCRNKLLDILRTYV